MEVRLLVNIALVSHRHTVDSGGICTWILCLWKCHTFISCCDKPTNYGGRLKLLLHCWTSRWIYHLNGQSHFLLGCFLSQHLSINSVIDVARMQCEDVWKNFSL